MGQIKANGEQFETYIESDYRGQLLRQGADSGAVDAFGRQRISSPLTLFDSVLRYDKMPSRWNETIVGSGVSTHLSNESSIAMGVSASGDSVLRRTKKRFPYQAGKSLLIYQSFVGAPLQTGLLQEVGYFDDNNGIMVRASGTTVQFVIRSKTSGSVVENIVSQNEWNIDGASWLNFAKANIFVTDLEWLGVGRVRTGFIIDGEYYYCHEFKHANSIFSVYMTSAVQPLSYRIAASATVSGATMKQICSSVMSEAGYEATGEIYTIAPPIGSIPNVSGERIVAGIRMASGRTDNVIVPAKINLVCTTTDTIYWRLIKDGTISGVTWAAASNGRGNVETISSGTISSGTTIDAGFFTTAGSVEVDLSSGLVYALGQEANGTSETLVLTVNSVENAKAAGLLGWRETL